MKAIWRPVLIKTTIKQIILESNLEQTLERVKKFKYPGLVTDQTLTVERARQLHRENFFKIFSKLQGHCTDRAKFSLD